MGPAGAARHRSARSGDDAVEMPASDAAAARRATARRAPASGPAHPLVVLHVSAGNPFRRWPLESFAAVAAALAVADRRAAWCSPAVRPRPTPRRGRRASQARVGRPSRRARCSRAASSPAELRALVDRARALHRRRQRPAARRGHDHGRSSRCSVRRCRRGRAVARRRLVRPSVETRTAALPAVRPAHVRAGRLPVPDGRSPPTRSSIAARIAAGGAGHELAPRRPCRAPADSASTRASASAGRRCSASSARCSSPSPPPRSACVAVAAWLAARRERRNARGAALLLAAGRLCALTLISAAFSRDPATSFVDSKQLVAVPDRAGRLSASPRGPRARTLVTVHLSSARPARSSASSSTACSTTTTSASGRRARSRTT